MKTELELYKESLRKSIEDRIAQLQSDREKNGFTVEQNYTYYAVITELQMTLELISTTLPTEVCYTCGRVKKDVQFCSNTFHLPITNSDTPITESYDGNMFGSKYREDSSNWDDPAIGHFKD